MDEKLKFSTQNEKKKSVGAIFRAPLGMDLRMTMVQIENAGRAPHQDDCGVSPNQRKLYYHSTCNKMIDDDRCGQRSWKQNAEIVRKMRKKRVTVIMRKFAKQWGEMWFAFPP